jgi:hypothetical protein
MVINKGDLAFTGSDGGICGYFLHDQNIIRCASTRTGATIQENPAFDGFRKSSNRLKEAAPIAASLYNQLPKDQKQFSLYRLLTGETIKMIKEGMDKVLITELLFKQYIEPRLLHPENYLMVTLRLNPDQPGKKHLYSGRVKGFRKLKTWKIQETENEYSAKPVSSPKEHPDL